MSHQTGIKANDELREFFGQCKEGSVRLVKIGIKDEQLVLEKSDPPSRSWEDDYDILVHRSLERKEPCFVLYRLDSKNHSGYEWLFISYSPDNSPVRRKMLYAATRATLKSEFGGGNIKHELFGTVPEDVLLEGYKRHITAEDAPAPLTYAEEELEMIKKNEVRTDVSVDSKHQTIQGISFPISNEALQRLQELKDGRVNYVQLCLDLTAEIINLDNCQSTDTQQLPSRIRSDHARYHFFTFKHTHEGDYLETIMFIYSMPGYKCPIKERMLYSSCKSPLLDIAEQQMGIEIGKKMEVDSPEEVTEECLYDALHPAKNVARQQFARPRGPAGRGPKRMTRAKVNEGSTD
ncbi:Twinfilin-1 [Lamellibrachia satsuma]|nr:Twinfilin-1 [Lamellibrachia satsuma]